MDSIKRLRDRLREERQVSLGARVVGLQPEDLSVLLDAFEHVVYTLPDGDAAVQVRIETFPDRERLDDIIRERLN
jgi:hypothetical protein